MTDTNVSQQPEPSNEEQFVIAVTGCVHGHISDVYEQLQQSEHTNGIKPDIVLCTGDFEAVRDVQDLESLKAPEKYLLLGEFWEFYVGKKVAPYLTLVVGGNHEASSHMWSLYYSGWIAPNIFYLGAAGSFYYEGFRIVGLSGIYNFSSFNQREVPVPPYISVGRKASAFHCRSFTGEMIKALSPTAHILMVHDWSVDAARNGDTNTLLKHRPAFREDVNQNKLGSPLTAELIQHFRPSYCFASHMHYKFQASIPHTTSLFPDSRSATTFLALDKMTEPFEKAKGKQRQSIQLITFPRSALPRPGAGLEYDPEWLSLIRIVHPHVTLSLRSEGQFTVGSMWYPLLSFLERTTGRTTEDRMKEEVAWVQTNVPNLAVPFNFEREAHRGLDLDMKERWTEQGRPRTLPPLPTTGRSDGAYAQFSKNLPFSTFESSPQTTALLTKLGLVPFPATFDDFFQLAQRNPKTPFAPHAASSAADAMPAPAPLEVSKNDEEIEL